MARVQYGATVTGLSGTLNGITFSRNATCQYAKSWSRPPLSRSTALTESRGRLANASQAWADLTSGEKTDWNDFALSPNETDYDPWGDTRYLTGFQWYSRACARRALVGLDPDTAVPTGAALDPIAGFALSIEDPTSGTSTVSWDSGEFAADHSAILFLAATPSLAAADVWRGWKLILAKQDPGDTGEDISSEVYDAFGAIPVGWYMFGRLFDQAELGNRSSVAVANTQIVATP